MKHETKEVSYKVLEITSPAFGENQLIPAKYTCDGDNINPPLNIEHIPKEAKSLAIIADDPDALAGTWAHWVVWNIPATHRLSENMFKGTHGMNDFGKHIYCGPCPPGGIHRYCFKIYALDCKLDIPVSSDKSDLKAAISEHILAFGELTGRYKRNK